MNNLKKWVEETLDGSFRRVIPIMTYPGIELCGRTIRDAVTNGEVHAEAICLLNSKYPADAVTSIMDLTVEAEAFGAKVAFSDEEIPTVLEPLLNGYEAVKTLNIPSLSAARIPEYLKANRLVVNRILDKPVFGGCIGPFSLAARLYGISEIMIAMFDEPETVHLLLNKCVTFLSDYCHAIKDIGVDGIIMAEPVAGLISDIDCETYSSAYVRQIADFVQDDNFLLVLHNCGNTGHCTESMCHSGARALHFGNKIDLREVLKTVPSDILVMGNLDPVALFKQASADEMFVAARELLQQTKFYPNFIISSGCDIPPHVPFRNIEAFYRAVKASY